MTVPEKVRGSIDAVLSALAPALRRALRRRFPSGRGLDFDEIEQEARIRLWKALERETDIESPASYVARIAVSVTIDALRRQQTRREEPLEAPPPGGDDDRPAFDPADPEATPERRAELSQLRERVSAALDRVAPDRRRAVRLHLQGWQGPEIARLCDWSEARARNLVYRGLADLRAELAREGIDHA